MLRTAGDRPAPALRLNLAIGLFDQAAATTSTLHEFRLRNLEIARCRFVVASDSTVFGDEALAPIASQIRVDRITPGGLTVEQAWTQIVVALPGDAGSWPLDMDRAAADTAVPALARQNRRLIQHLENGGGVLVVGLDDQAEQQAVAGLLLRLASGVLTHQIRATAAGGFSHKSINRPADSARAI